MVHSGRNRFLLQTGGNNKYRYIRALGLNSAHLTLLQGLRAFAHHDHWLIQREPQYGDATEHGLIAALQDYLSIKARMAREPRTTFSLRG